MRTALIVAGAALSGFASAGWAAVLGSYTAESVSISGNLSPTMPVQSELAGVDLTPMGVGNTARRSSGHSVDSFSLTWGGQKNESLAFAITNNYYYQFTITPEAGHRISLSSFNFKMFLPERSSATVNGTVFWLQPEFNLFSSVTGDGDAAYEAGEQIATRLFTTPELTTSLSNYNGSFDVSGVAALQNFESAVTFRIYVHNTIPRAIYTSPTGTTFTRANGYEPIGIGEDDIANQTNAFVVNGDVSPVPEPAAVAGIALLAGGFLSRRRRR